MMKYYLCYWVGDGGDRESYSVFYSQLVMANDEEQALEKYFKQMVFPAKDKNNYGCTELKPIV